MHRERGLSSREHHRHSRNAAYEEHRRRDYTSRPSRDERNHHKPEHWPPGKPPRFEQSRSRSPASRGEPQKPAVSMAGLIFMCNKKTQRRCLAYQVLGMPMAKKKLADQITPGMPLFLFEFESRELFGVYEATSHVGMDLEPKAFVEADIDFPLQVRFRVLHKCPPLREAEYKEAIQENYFQATRFKFILNKEQVSRLLKLFVSVGSYDRLNSSRNLQYQAPSSYDNGVDYRGLTTTTSSRGYQPDDHRNDDYWRKETGVTPYSESAGDYRKEEQWRKDPELFSKTSYVDSHRSLEYYTQKEASAYVPEYKHTRYYEAQAPKPGGTHRYDSELPAGYEYVSGLEQLQSLPVATLQHQNQSGLSAAAPSYQSKYDLGVSGYGLARAEVVPIVGEPPRYWKPDENVMPAADPQYGKPVSLYNSRQMQALPGYSTELGNPSIPENSYRMASWKVVYPEVEYEYVPAQVSAVPGVAPAPAPVTVTHDPGDCRGFTSSLSKPMQETGDYRGAFSSSGIRKPSLYGHPDDGFGSAAKYPGRFSVPDALPPDCGYHLQQPVTGISLLETTTTRERYRQELSPRPETKYIPAPAPTLAPAQASARHLSLEQEARFVAPEPGIGAYELPLAEEISRYEVQPEMKRYEVEASPRRGNWRSPERYVEPPGRFAARESPGRRFVRRKASVWDRVSRGKFQRTHGGGHYQRRREYSPGLEDEEAPASGEDEGFVDFKRRGKGNQVVEDCRENDQEEARHRKKRIVRPA